MAWSEVLGDLVALGGVPGAARSYVRGQLIQTGVAAGQSANAILRGLSSVGVGIRRDQALAMVRAEQARQQAGATSAALDLTSPIDELLGTTPPANWTGQYVHQVTATFRTKDEEGDYELHTRTFGIKSTNILTPEEAISATQDIIAQNPAEEGGSFDLSPGDILTMGLTGAWFDTQNRNIPIAGGGGVG